MSHLRSDRARRRAAKQRNQRVVLILILFVLIAAGAYFAYTAFFAKNNPAANPTSEAVTELKIEDLVVGTGPEAQAGDIAQVYYTGWLTDGTQFDSNAGSGNPFNFTIGAGQVIPGWDQGVAGMKVGGKRKLTIPPDLGYGAQANGPIPANSTLVFEVELVGMSN